MPIDSATQPTAAQLSALKRVIRIARDGFAFINDAASSAQEVSDRNMIDPNTLTLEQLRAVIPDAGENDLALYAGFWQQIVNTLEDNNGALRKAFRRIEGAYDATFNR